MDKNYGFFRVAAAVPILKVGDVAYNTGEVLYLLERAHEEDVALLVFPELCLTGYTCADLFLQKELRDAVVRSLGELVQRSKNFRPIFVVGLPLMIQGKLYNIAAVIHNGELYGLVPKTNLPNYREFYEARWFASARDLIAREIQLPISGRLYPVAVGADLLFNIPAIDLTFGVEICEDLWVPIPPSSLQAQNGALLHLNLSASNAVVGKADYRRQLVAQQSARNVAGYVYASSGVHESTTDVVFDGHALIAENGSILAESERFRRNQHLLKADIDLDYLLHDRATQNTFPGSTPDIAKREFRTITLIAWPAELRDLKREINSMPFVPSRAPEREIRCKEIFSIQVAGLAKRLERTAAQGKEPKLVLGLSGGLDSTLALLVAVEVFEMKRIPLSNIYSFSLPGFGTTKRTKSNSEALARALGATFEEVSIVATVRRELKDLQHSGEQDTAFENAQARYRTNFLMTKANQIGGMLLGTGDLSELALGWCTFGGDHISFYNPNCGIPKTLVKYLVQYVAETQANKDAKKALLDILATPISPELIKPKKGKISQKTEELIGPYELHDFFLYHFVRWGAPPEKIYYLAHCAWRHKYSRDEIIKWLIVFLKRFFAAQWKRSVATDGPKVGSVSLSPRGDWRMPSDAEVAEWLKKLEE